MELKGHFLQFIDHKITGNEKVIHVIFWMVYFCLNVVRWGSFFDDYSYALKSNLVEFPIHMVLVYLNLYVLLPKLIPQKPIAYIFILFISMMFMSLLRIELTFRFVTQEVWLEIPNQVDRYNLNYIIEVFIGELYVVGIITAIKLIIDNSRNIRLNKELSLRNYETEIELLKSQIQPHFFLNTLNNLYALTLEKSDKAPDLIEKLAEVMKYLVYQTKKEEVHLSEEITLIDNFLALEKLRFGDRLKITFNVSENINEVRIAPLILFPFVEYMFKIETNNKLGQIDIKINIKRDHQHIHFTMENKKYFENDHDRTKKNIDLGRNGIKSTKRRLDLLFYKNYILDIIDTDNFYKLLLKIPYAND